MEGKEEGVQDNLTTGCFSQYPGARYAQIRITEKKKRLQHGKGVTNHLQLEANGPAPLPQTRERAVNLGLYPFDPGLHLTEPPGPPPVPSRERPTT